MRRRCGHHATNSSVAYLLNALPPLSQQLRRDATQILRAALRAVGAGDAVRRHFALRGNVLHAGEYELPLEEFDRVRLLAIGKAAAPMAAAVGDLLAGRLAAALVVTKHGHSGKRRRGFRVIEAGHPIPDKNGLEAGRAVEQMLAELGARDLLIVAVSGGASALLPAPVAAVTFEAKQRTTNLLLRAGADIVELNAVRKHLSRLKGGGLVALAYPATAVGLLLSDVIGDRLDVIGSGLTAPDPTSFADALAVLEKYDLLERAPASVRKHFEAAENETPKPGDRVFERVYNVVAGSNRLALAAAAEQAKLLGYNTLVLSSTLSGETREVARVQAEILREVIVAGQPIVRPACLVAGGETTVTVRGRGKGGRNQEFALAGAIALDGLPNALIASCGTDGSDGPTDAAGAIATGETVGRGRTLGLSAAEHLRNNNSYPFFEALGDLIKTGPTGTNVMDVHLLLAR